MVNLRCSSLDSLFNCTPSVTETSGMRVAADSEAAKLGNIGHALAADYVQNGKFDLKNECARSGWEDEETVAECMSYAVRAWDEIKKYFPTPAVERLIASDPIEVGGIQYTITGGLDVVSTTRKGGAIFNDWKFGFLDEGYHNQMYGYAYCLWNKLGRKDDCEIIGIVSFLRHRYYRTVIYPADKLRDWERHLIKNVLPATQTYKPGTHCKYCSLYSTCAAQRQLTTNTLQQLTLPTASDAKKNTMQKGIEILASVTPDNKNEPEVRETINTMTFRIKLAQAAIDKAKELIRGTIERVGPIQTSEDTQLALRDVEVRSVDGGKGLKILRQHLSDPEILDAAKISLPKLLASKAAKFARGEKSAARNQLELDLEKAGAIRINKHQRLEEIDIAGESEVKRETPEVEISTTYIQRLPIPLTGENDGPDRTDSRPGSGVSEQRPGDDAGR